jgi:hypothetical protein
MISNVVIDDDEEYNNEEEDNQYESEENDDDVNEETQNNDNNNNNQNEEETKKDPYAHLPKSLRDIIEELNNKNVLNLLIKPKQNAPDHKKQQLQKKKRRRSSITQMFQQLSTTSTLKQNEQQPSTTLIPQQPEQPTLSVIDKSPVTLEELLDGTQKPNAEIFRKNVIKIEIDIENIDIFIDEEREETYKFNESSSSPYNSQIKNKNNFSYDLSSMTNIGAPIDIDINLTSIEMKPFSFKEHDDEHIQFHQKQATINEITNLLSSTETTTRYTKISESRKRIQKRSKNLLSLKQSIRKVINTNKLKQTLPSSMKIPYKRHKVEFKKNPLDYILLVDNIYFSQVMNSFTTAKEIVDHIKIIGLDFVPSKHAKSIEISEMFLSEVITFLVKNNRILDVTRILLQINAEILNESMVKQAIQGTKLVNAFTYLITHSGDKSDFMKPLEYMYALFGGVESSEQYNQFMGCAVGDVNIIQCKQYFGHRLFWYCNFCLDKYTFPERYPMDNDIYVKLVPKIFLFLSSDEVCSKLVEFDSFTYFTVYSRFFTENEINKYININFSKDPEIDCNYQGAKRKEPNFVIKPLTMLENVLNICIALKSDNVYILNDAFEFIDKYYDNPQIENEVRINKTLFHTAINHFLNYQYIIKRLTNENDPFMCHQPPDDYNESKLKQDLENKAIRLLKQVDGEELEKDKFNSEEIKSLIQMASKTNFTKAEIMLFTMEKNYVQVLHCKIKLILNQGENGLDVDKDELFQWIQYIIEELSGKSKEEVDKKNKFIDAVYLQFINLCNISIIKVLEIIKKYFYKDHNRVIETLKCNPPLQFDFLKRFLGEHEDKKNSSVPDIALNIEVQDQMDEQEANAKQQQQINNENYIIDNNDDEDAEIELNTVDQMYLQLIKLSLDLGEKKLLTKILANRPNLCNKKVLELLNQHKAYENAVYVCQVIGGYEDGIQMTTLAIKNTYNDITNNFKNNVFRETKNVYYLQKMKRLITLGIEICNSHSEKSHDYKGWIKLLEALYDFRCRFKEFKKVFKANARYLDYEFKRVENTILSGLESIFEIMEKPFKINGLVEFVSSNCTNAGYVEFRQIVMKEIYSLRKSLRLFERSLKILQDHTKKEFFELLDSKRKGKLYTLGIDGRSKVCMVCHESLSHQRKGEKKGKSIPVIIFPCDHYYHTNCCAQEGEYTYVCAVCRQQEIDMYPGYLKHDLFIPSLEVENEEKKEGDEEKKEGEKEGIVKPNEEQVDDDESNSICKDPSYRTKKKNMLKNFREKMFDKHNEVDKMIKCHGKLFKECGEGDEMETNY